LKGRKTRNKPSTAKDARRNNVSQATDIYEKLGVFYLGRDYDCEANTTLPSYTLYDSKDLVTHAVIVGMTGSGKTGLGIGMLEEAAIDGIPALVIDPKGDLTNLLLNFPALRPDEFQPWVNADDARRQEKTVEEFAADQATLWQNGLAQWDQDGARIQRLRDASDYAIYTPGSDAGLPISMLSSFAAPPQQVLDDGDLFRDRVSSTVTSLLALLAIDADPIRSREHILLTNILSDAWMKGRSLELGSLIQAVQSPPMQKIGVMDRESFFPAKDRFALAMTLNNLLASPSFAAWMTGEPLDIDRLLYTPSGKPRMAIFSIAHLPEAERMFFMSLLLNQTLGWMRSRPGTTSLRAMLYIDEIFGFMPPVAEPPTKKPLLTLLKQARAYGLGLVLATQNPVDLDYKGLSNTGTWFLGRLQTERDKQRVLDGLEGATSEAGAKFDRGEIGKLLSSLGKRVFLMHNVHESEPVTFQTRWTLSYLAGPMTRTQIRQLMDQRKPTPSATKSTHPDDDFSADLPPLAEWQEEASPTPAAPAPSIPVRPVLSPRIEQTVLAAKRFVTPEQLVYKPYLLALCKVHYVESRGSRYADEELSFLASADVGVRGVSWDEAEQLTDNEPKLDTELSPAHGITELPAATAEPTNYTQWRKELEDHLYRTCRYDLYYSPVLDTTSFPGESDRDFRIRIADIAREARDQEIEKLRKKYATKLNSAEERIRKAEVKLAKERQEASGAKMDSMISFGATVLSAVFGRKSLGSRTLGRATTAARGASRSARQHDDVHRAESNLEAYEDQLAEIEHELQQEVDAITDRFDPLQQTFDTVQLKPRRSDVNVRLFALAWVPHIMVAGGELRAAYK
jgi:hypothetical protein